MKVYFLTFRINVGLAMFLNYCIFSYDNTPTITDIESPLLYDKTQLNLMF